MLRRIPLVTPQPFDGLLSPGEKFDSYREELVGTPFEYPMTVSLVVLLGVPIVRASFSLGTPVWLSLFRIVALERLTTLVQHMARF